MRTCTEHAKTLTYDSDLFSSSPQQSTLAFPHACPPAHPPETGALAVRISLRLADVFSRCEAFSLDGKTSESANR